MVSETERFLLPLLLPLLQLFLVLLPRDCDSAEELEQEEASTLQSLDDHAADLLEWIDSRSENRTRRTRVSEEAKDSEPLSCLLQ